VDYTAQLSVLGLGRRWIRAAYVPLYSRNETVDGWIAVIADITELLEAQERLRLVNAKLARANQDLERFAFVASHDLQEPLRMVTTFAELLVKTHGAPMEQGSRLENDTAMFVENIVEGTRRMRELLSDLLTYAEIGEQEELVETVDLNAVVGTVTKNLTASIDESRAAITYDFLPTVSANKGHLVSVFQNLIGNAIKYRGAQSPRIHIAVQETGGQFEFAVADNGIGIEPAYHATIFGVFKRLHGKKVPGTGIGLAICQRLVERYGGRIWVESELGQGATFRFTLPKTAVAAGIGNE
jgi:light-regulated signal transduction histidine kinase (bacteriophytochrome)